MFELLCFCLCLFDAIVELHAMNEKMFIVFSLESEVDFICNKGVLNS